MADETASNDTAPSYLESLPENIRSEPSLVEAKDVPTLAQRYLDTKRMVGNSVALPPKDAPPELQEQWFKDNRAKLAERGFIKVAPAKIEDYKVSWGEGVEIPQEIDGALRAFAHSRGWHNDELQALAEFYSNNVAGSVKESPQTEAEKQLTELVGGSPENFKEAVALATDAIGALEEKAFPGLWDKIEGEKVLSADGRTWTPRSSDPLTIYLLAELGRKTGGEASNGQFKGAGGSGPDQIRAEIEQIRSDKNNPFYKLIEKGDQNAQDYLDGLYKKLYGTREIEQK